MKDSTLLFWLRKLPQQTYSSQSGKVYGGLCNPGGLPPRTAPGRVLDSWASGGSDGLLSTPPLLP